MASQSKEEIIKKLKEKTGKLRKNPNQKTKWIKDDSDSPEWLSFHERLEHFGPRFSVFLEDVWNVRDKIKLEDFFTGVDQIYQMYSLGIDEEQDFSDENGTIPYDEEGSLNFTNALMKICCDNKDPFDETQNVGFLYKITMQKDKGYGNYNAMRELDHMRPEDPKKYAHLLWKDFFHVHNTTKKQHLTTTSRIYINAKNIDARLEIMKFLVQEEFPKNEFIKSAKVAGPGFDRLDNIVIYLTDKEKADDLAYRLCDEFSEEFFEDKLPLLVKQIGPGVGRAGNPPQMKLHKDQAKARNSFGSFFARLMWIALKAVPINDDGKMDPRHFLDNLRHEMECLEMNITDPYSFPSKEKIEEEAGKIDSYYEEKNKVKSKSRNKTKSIRLYPTCEHGHGRPQKPYTTKHDRMVDLAQAEQALRRLRREEEMLVQEKEKLKMKIAYFRQKNKHYDANGNNNEGGSMEYYSRTNINQFAGRRRKTASNTLRGRRMIEKTNNEFKHQKSGNMDEEFWC